MTHRQRPVRRRQTGLFAVLTLVAVACGGGDPPTAGPEGDSTTPRPTDDATDDAGVEATSTTATPETTEATSTTVTTTTTVPLLPAVPRTTIDDIPALIVEWERAADDPSIDPLDLAQRLIGFPLPIPAPEGATAYRVDLDMFAGAEPSAWRWEWRYSAFASGPVGDVDIDLDDKGAGTVELAATYDPIMTELGWRRTGTTTSDPGEPGGPNSVNHVYQYEGPQLVVDGSPAVPDPTFVWLDEDLIFGDDEQPGFRFGVNIDIEAGAVVVPLIESIVAALPEVPGTDLVGVDLSSFERPSDSFDADEGLRYLDLELVLQVPADAAGAARTAYSTGLGDAVLRAATESFFDPGHYRSEDAVETADGWRLPILLLDRYDGSITVAPPTSGESVEVSVEVSIEANRELLTPVPE